jgi:phosphoribosylformylglycinamidine synthase
VVRQYDHEVQAGSVIKPLVGAANDGPSDASVVRPVLTSRRGLVISNGMNPCYGDFDTYWMAASAIDEAIRNAVAVGADPRRLAILDNFCWGNTDRPETLGSLVRAALACHDMAIALETPFISGKDSLNNEFRPSGAEEPISIPPSLLISALGQVEDIAQCVTMDLKRPGNLIYLVGLTKNELGGSHYTLVENLTGGEVPKVDFAVSRKTFDAIHHAIRNGLLRACHDLSEGGLACAIAEMAFAGGHGAKINLNKVPTDLSPLPMGEGLGVRAAESSDQRDAILLFSESNTRFLCEVTPENAAAFESTLQEIPHAKIGEVTATSTLEIHTDKPILEETLATLKETWQKPLRW